MRHKDCDRIATRFRYSENSREKETESPKKAATADAFALPYTTFILLVLSHKAGCLGLLGDVSRRVLAVETASERDLASLLSE